MSLRFLWRASFLVLISAFLSIGALAQEEEADTTKIPFKDRLVYGGGMGLSFGDITFVNLSPTIGYRIKPRWVSGTGVTFSYWRDNVLDITASTYGGSLWTRYFFFDNLFGHGEYELLNGDWVIGRDRFNVHSIFVGGGYNMRLAGNTFFNVIGLWNLNPGAFSPYINPVIRGGISIGM